MSLNDSLSGLTNSLGGFSHGISQIKKFVLDNNIVGTSAGVGVGLAAKDGIQSFVNDIIMPSLASLFHYLNFDAASKFLPVGEKSKLNIVNFIKQMITFIITVAVSFIFVKLSFDYLLGIDTTKKDAEKKEANPFKKEPEMPKNTEPSSSSSYGSTRELFGPLRGY
jgi:large-conductance mechanosensitive channel